MSKYEHGTLGLYDETFPKSDTIPDLTALATLEEENWIGKHCYYNEPPETLPSFDEPTRVVPLHRLPDEAIDRRHRADLQRFFVGDER